jgi:hypothetical protein
VDELTKIQRLERKVRVLTFASILSVLIVLACGWTFRQQQSDTIRVRQIVIVDEKEQSVFGSVRLYPIRLCKGNDRSVQVLCRGSSCWMRKAMNAVGTSLQMAPARYS